MALEIKLNQKLSQSLVMTPQLQQAIKLLQLGRLEYLEMIEKELLENPILEDASEETLESGAGVQVADIVQQLAGEEAGEYDTEMLKRSSQERSSSDSADSAEYFDSYQESYSRSSSKNLDHDGERPSIEATLSNPEGLVSHLLWQLRTSDLAREDFEVAAQIVGNLDRNGYLCCTVEELSTSCLRAPEDVERVLKTVQYLDPPGIAARDLGECLLLQLEQLGSAEGLAARIVRSHLPKLESRRYEQIAKEEGVKVEEVYEAIKQIRKLEPRPGRPFVDEAPIYITPDIYVRKIGDDYVISLNEAGVPKLRLNNHYRDLLSVGKTKDLPDREYLQDRLKSAAWLIKSVHQRQQTIYKVTESIVKFQREFLERGVALLKPLVLKDVAEDVGMHESTVSRVTTNKYVHTPQGVFELKFFFTSGLKSGEGEISSESVKERIRTLVNDENSDHPLSDQALVNILRAEGVDIARRTVAKYREMMNIESSSRRKKVF